MNIFAVALLQNAQSVKVAGDQVSLMVDDVTICYRKHLCGFDVAIDVTIDGESYYTDYIPETQVLLAQTRLFFEMATQFATPSHRRPRGELRRKLRRVFGAATCSPAMDRCKQIQASG